jgi:hypothetical protein
MSIGNIGRTAMLMADSPPEECGSYEFIAEKAQLLDARTLLHGHRYSRAMAVKIIGGGSQYTLATPSWTSISDRR